MLKIGAFSKICQVPVKTLRFYGQIGLLVPADVDEFTGYRRYALEQVQRLNRILALKDLGFSLEQIGTQLDESLSPEELRGMLRLKQAEAAQQLEITQVRLDRIAYRLALIEQEENMPTHEVVQKQTESLRVAAVRDILPDYGRFGELYNALIEALQSAGVDPLGPIISINYDEEYKESDVDMEAAVAIGSDVDLPEGGRAVVRELPGVTVASTVHPGPYSQLSVAYRALLGWIQANGYVPGGPNREIYLQGPSPGIRAEDYVTEIQFPIRRA